MAASFGKPLCFGLVLIMGVLSQSCYILRQAGGFLDDRSRAQPTARLLDNPATGESTRTFLSRVEAIRSFGTTELGLSDTGNYTTYIATQRNYIVKVVEAAGEFSLEPHTWWFPFFGDSPYLGFYDPLDAETEAVNLRKAGFDVSVREVQGFSTLGVFKDPLYTFMESWDDWRLASLIFHEQTHASIWIGGDFAFNEQLATFIGYRGALEYLRHSKSSSQEVEQRLADWQADQAEFYRAVADLRRRLATVYHDPELDPEERRQAKAQVIADFRSAWQQEAPGRLRSQAFAGAFPPDLNNAWLAAMGTYTGQINRFDAAFAAHGNSVRDFLLALRRLPRDKAAVQRWLDSWKGLP